MMDIKHYLIRIAGVKMLKKGIVGLELENNDVQHLHIDINEKEFGDIDGRGSIHTNRHLDLGIFILLLLEHSRRL